MVVPRRTPLAGPWVQLCETQLLAPEFENDVEAQNFCDEFRFFRSRSLKKLSTSDFSFQDDSKPLHAFHHDQSCHIVDVSS